MISKIKAFFDKSISSSEDAHQKVEDQMNLAAAALLIEIAYSDHDIAEVEKSTLKDLLAKQFSLSDATIDELVVLAEDEVVNSNSAYEFTRLVNTYFEKEEKFKLIQAMWTIAYADGNIDRYEEFMIRKLSDLLYVSHSEFIRAKISVQEQVKEQD